MDRLKLKYQLSYQRGRCAVCAVTLGSDGFDMHEAIITRGNTLGSDADIMVPQNCVLVHTNGCHKHAHTNEGRRICIDDLLTFEGDNVLKWLLEIAPLYRSGVIDERVRLVMEVLNEQKEDRSNGRRSRYDVRREEYRRYRNAGYV